MHCIYFKARCSWLVNVWSSFHLFIISSPLFLTIYCFTQFSIWLHSFAWFIRNTVRETIEFGSTVYPRTFRFPYTSVAAVSRTKTCCVFQWMFLMRKLAGGMKPQICEPKIYRSTGRCLKFTILLPWIVSVSQFTVWALSAEEANRKFAEAPIFFGCPETSSEFRGAEGTTEASFAQFFRPLGTVRFSQ